MTWRKGMTPQRGESAAGKSVKQGHAPSSPQVAGMVGERLVLMSKPEFAIPRSSYFLIV